ncbi:MAG: cupin domain-containing protein [Phycisphaerae bacterium]|jgi:anti-sigma factor ChrR (cupin superfamily)|nr:cupin domain-containing protein [Phycisphaerae bacterium]MCZ2400668.1 cupin domain-containing protein [Phycisphaerae bacterium]NUQ50416.1 cupin domain-containing protein [Phycisphaerae bacterium]
MAEHDWHNHPEFTPAEWVTLYVSGALSEPVRGAFEEHLKLCESCRLATRGLEAATRDALDAPGPLDRAAPSTVPHAAAGGDTQVWKRWTPPPTRDGLCIVRAEDGAWEDTGVAGVAVRQLYADRAHNRATMLVRMTPGAAYPRHLHNSPEECLVLEGDLSVGANTLHSGDYQRAEPGSTHGVQSTRAGCLLFIVSGLDDDLLPD